MLPVVQAGHIYIAQPPFYKMTAGKKIYYAYTDDEKDRIIAELAAERQKKKADLAENNDEIESNAEGGEEEKQILKQAGISSLQRYKGLGEMDADQLWETTMDPENRVLLKVNIEDGEKADAIFNKLMGSEVELRKNFIQTHAKYVKDLDV